MLHRFQIGGKGPCNDERAPAEVFPKIVARANLRKLMQEKKAKNKNLSRMPEKGKSREINESLYASIVVLISITSREWLLYFFRL